MKVNTNISVDAELKKEATKLFQDLGLDFSSAITLFLKQAVREQRIPFTIGRNIPNETSMSAIKEVKYMEKHPKEAKTFKDVDSLMEDLKS